MPLTRPALTAIALTLALTACNAAPEADKPYVPQITHSPKNEDPKGLEGIDGGDQAPTNGDETSNQDRDGESADAQDIPAAPVLPEFSDDREEAAKQVIDYYIDAFNFGYMTGDTAPLASISHPDCPSCATQIEEIEELHRSDYVEEGGYLELNAIELEEINGSVMTFKAIVTQSEIVKNPGTADESLILEELKALSNIYIYSAGSDLKILATEVLGEAVDER